MFSLAHSANKNLKLKIQMCLKMAILYYLIFSGSMLVCFYVSNKIIVNLLKVLILMTIQYNWIRIFYYHQISSPTSFITLLGSFGVRTVLRKVIQMMQNAAWNY